MSQSDNPDGLTEAQRAEIRELIRDEQANSATITRRDALKGGGLLAGLAALGGGATGSAAADLGDGGGEALAVGSATANTYRITANRYGGADAAKSELVSELDGDDAGAKFSAEDTGALYHWDGSGWVLMPAERESINTGSATSTGLSASTVPPSSKSLIAQQSGFSWTEINWEDKGEAIINGSANPDNSEAGYVGIIPGSVFDNPLDNWYFFWSGDNPSNILLSTASTLYPSEAEMTFQGVVLDRNNLSVNAAHIASPWPVVDPKADELKLYYHRSTGSLPGQLTDLATISLSGDGTSASRDQLVIKSQLNGRWDAQERTYLAVRRTANGYVGVYNGRDQDEFLNAPGIAVARSVDGEEWTTEPTPAFDGVQFGSFDPQNNNGGIPGLFRLGGELHVTYYDVNAGEARVLPLSQRHTATFADGETVIGLPSWDSGSDAPVINDVVAHGGYLYLFYHIHASGGATEIGVKRAELGGIA